MARQCDANLLSTVRPAGTLCTTLTRPFPLPATRREYQDRCSADRDPPSSLADLDRRLQRLESGGTRLQVPDPGT
jgi:hypothetical protein